MNSVRRACGRIVILKFHSDRLTWRRQGSYGRPTEGRGSAGCGPRIPTTIAAQGSSHPRADPREQAR
ncbi:hypothetical protein KPATCC21470_5797 [Kitasatospora purpeofusca]